MDDVSDYSGSYHNEFKGNGQMMLLIQDAKNKAAKIVFKRVKGFRIDGSRVIFDHFDGLKWKKKSVKLSRLLGACAP